MSDVLKLKEINDINIDDFKTDNLTFKQDGSFMGSTNFVSSLWLPDIQIFKCKQFKKRQIVTDVAGQSKISVLRT